MNFCPHCGNPVDPQAAVCLHCGRSVANNSGTPTDDGSFLWAVLGWFVPIAGLILWIMWKDTAPRNAKKAGLGALISTIAGVVLTVIIYIIYFAIVAFTIVGS